jgi:hypothetical protein
MMSHIDGLDIVIRQKDGKVIAWMLQLSLYAKLRGISVRLSTQANWSTSELLAWSWWPSPSKDDMLPSASPDGANERGCSHPIPRFPESESQ